MIREVEGWHGISLRRHVEKAQSAADDAHEIASDARDGLGECRDEQVILKARISELESRMIALETAAEGRGDE